MINLRQVFAEYNPGTTCTKIGALGVPRKLLIFIRVEKSIPKMKLRNGQKLISLPSTPF